MTSLGAIGHEITHSWFGRGVMPANGNAGWIDEAIASWRDHGYIRSAIGPSGPSQNIGGFSPYRRHTAVEAYSGGRLLIEQLDKTFESVRLDNETGMRAVLRALYAKYKNKTITVDVFKRFMEEMTGTDLTATFAKYVYGQPQN